MYHDRKLYKIIDEKESADGMVTFLYKTVPGRILLKSIIARPTFSKMAGKYLNSKYSKPKIKKFIKENDINMNEQDIKKYRSFNEFFLRKGCPPPQHPNTHIVAPADARLSYFEIDEDLILHIKNSTYNIAEILGSKEDAEYFRGGTCLVFRMTLTDNHWYYFIDNGKTISHKRIEGELHTVRPISEKYRIYTRNTREVSILDTEHLGKIAQIEVGALLVGKMHNRAVTTFKKTEIKGHFELGGSTIVILLNKDIKMDKDIEKFNRLGVETKVAAGEKIGVIL